MAEESSARRRLLVAAGIVWMDGRLLLQRRSPRAAHGAGMLEFPGGKVEPGESPAEALRRELIEEWGPAAAQLRVGRVAEVLHHDYPPPGPEVILILYHVDAAAWADRDWRGQLHLLEGAELVEHAPSELPAGEFLEADRALVGRLRSGALQPD